MYDRAPVFVRTTKEFVRKIHVFQIELISLFIRPFGGLLVAYLLIANYWIRSANHTNLLSPLLPYQRNQPFIFSEY